MSVFMSQSGFQRGDVLDTGHSKSQPSAGAPQDPGWDEVDRPLNAMSYEVLGMASDPEQNPATADMNNALRG